MKEVVHEYTGSFATDPKGTVTAGLFSHWDRGLLIEEIRQAFFERMTADDLEELNFMSFDLEESSLGAVIDEAETLPFFGDYRLIFVEKPFFLTGEKKNLSLEQDLDSLLDYLKQPLETSVVVFWANYPKLDARKSDQSLEKDYRDRCGSTARAGFAKLFTTLSEQ